MSHHPRGPRVLVSSPRTTLDPEVALGSCVVTDWPNGRRIITDQGFTAVFDRHNHWVSACFDYAGYQQPMFLVEGDATDAQSRAYWERLAAAAPRHPVARPTPRAARPRQPEARDARVAAR